MPVKTLNGISFGARLRATISTSSIIIAPAIIETGITLLLLLPISKRIIFGITSPIHPIVPEMETENAVSNVAIRIQIPKNRL